MSRGGVGHTASCGPTDRGTQLSSRRLTHPTARPQGRCLQGKGNARFRGLRPALHTTPERTQSGWDAAALTAAPPRPPARPLPVCLGMMTLSGSYPLALASFFKASKDSWILLMSLPVGDTRRHEGEEGPGGGRDSVPAWGSRGGDPVGLHRGLRRAAASKGALPEDGKLARDAWWHP